MSTLLHHRDLAEDVSLVTFALLEALGSYPEASLPGGYRFHLFDGYPGFCDHAAAAGLALYRAFEAFDVDSLLEVVDGFAARAISLAVQHSAPASTSKLAALAEETRRRAVRSGLATLYIPVKAEIRIYDAPHSHNVATTLKPHTVFFELRQGLNTVVYAENPAQAVEVAKHLYELYNTDTGHFETDYCETADWNARSNGDRLRSNTP